MKQERLFFALWFNPTLSETIFKLTEQVAVPLQSRRLSSANLHLTLAFIGNCDAQQQSCLQTAAKTVTATPFSLDLDLFGYWQKPKVLWLAPSQPPPALLYLQSQLCQILHNHCAYQPEVRPYQPHVTLMRNLKQPPHLPSPTSIHWEINDFCLARSTIDERGVYYEVVQTFNLQQKLHVD